jgi:hypothetical protein
MRFTLPILTTLLLAPLVALSAADVRAGTWTEKWPDKDGKLQTIEVVAEVWTEAFQADLDEDGKLHIPAREKPYYLDAPLVMKSGQKLTADAKASPSTAPAASRSTPTPFAEPMMKWADASRLSRPLSKDPNVIEFGGRYLTYFSLPLFDAKLAAANATSGWSVGIAERRKRNFCRSDVYGEVVREILVSDEFISSTAGRISHSLCRHVAGRCE